MSGTSTSAKNSLYKSVLAGEMDIDPQLSDLSFSLSYPFDLGNEKLPGPLPPLPAWMLDTPMYSKLPMVPAPKGKIVLFTTSLCKKLHQVPYDLDLDFDPVAAGLCCEYKSLHDPHLKSHYTRPVTYKRLVKSGYITPDGMVKCSLKEFNDYHQYLKSVQLEKITQERKRMLLDERERLSRERKQSIRKDVDERDRRIKESLIKQKKVRDKERRKLSRKLQNDYKKTMMRLAEQRRKMTTLQQSRRKASEEKHHAIRMHLETEDKLKKALIKAKRTAEEIRRAELLKVKRKKEKEEKERKLEDQWDRHEVARAERMVREMISSAKKKEQMRQKVEMREEKVAKLRETQQGMFLHIREERQKTALNKEFAIANQLKKKIDSLCRKYTAGSKRGRRRFPPIHPKLTTNMTTWSILEKQKQPKEESSSEKLPPIVSSDESGVDKKRSGPPSMVIYETSLPSVKSSDFSQEMITIMEESELQTEVVSTGDAPVSLPEVLDSFTLVARQLVSAVFKELKADPEFENVAWEEGDDGTWNTDGQEYGAGVEGSVSKDIYIDASDVSPYASLMVANALRNVTNQLQEEQPPLVKVPTLQERARSIVSSVIKGALQCLLPSNHIELVENKGAVIDDPGQRSYEVDERLAGGGVDTVELSSIIEIFQEPDEGIPSITHTQASSDSESEAEDEGDAVIGIVENPILMDEIQHAGGPSGDMDVDEGLHVVLHKAEDGHLVVEGAVLTAEHDKQTITERILSDITLERASGSLSGVSGASSSRSGLARKEAAPSSSSEDEGEEIPEDHSFIVPIYQKNLINVGGHLVESHLSAISMKPEADGKFPSKGKCAARNSFRNIFRPDMTYCQGSARMLRDTLVKDIKSRQTASVPTGMDVVCEVLEQEEHDIMEKHSDEALVTMEETEGLCYLPARKKPKPVAPEAPPATAPVQVEEKSSDAPLGDEAAVSTKTSEVAPLESQEEPTGTGSNADKTSDEDKLPLATEENAKAANSDRTSTEQKTEIVPSSKSAMEARERALSAERQSTKREVSAQSVDASPNLTGSDEGSKRASRKSKIVTRSSSLISGVMSRLSHVFSGSRKKSNASVPSHESSSEPASRQSSKKSVEGITGGALLKGAQTQNGTTSGEESNLTASIVHQGASVHHGGSVHFTSMTIDPPVKKESIYAAHHRPQTPIPSVHIDVSLDDEEDEDEVVIDGDDVEEDVPVVTVEGPSRDAMTTGETEGVEVKNEIPPEEQTEVVVMETDSTKDAEPSSADIEMPIPTELADKEPMVEKNERQNEEANDESPFAETRTNTEAPPERQLQIENDSNNANTESGSKSPSRLPSIRTSQLQPPLLPSERTSVLSQGRDGPAPSGSRISQGSQQLMPPPVRSPSDRSLSGAQSMTITGRSLTPIGSKMAKSVTSTWEKEKRHSVEAVSSRSPSSGRGSKARLSHHRRVGSPQKRPTVSSQSASKVKSAYGSAAGLSVSGSHILPNKPSRSTSYNRRSSRTQAGLISATDLGSPSRGSRSKTGSRDSIVVPRPPSGVKPSGSAQSGHRMVRQQSGVQAMSNPTLTAAKGNSSGLVNHRSSSDRLLPRRPSLEKDNRMERLSTESVSSRRSSREKVAKKKSSGTQSMEEESFQEQKPAVPMPPIKESLTPRPPSQPLTSRQRSRPTSAAKKAVEDTASDAGQRMLGNDQATSEE